MSTSTDKIKNVMDKHYKSLDDLAETKAELDNNKNKYSDTFYNQKLSDIKDKEKAVIKDTDDKFKKVRAELQDKFNNWATLKSEDLDDLKLLDGRIQATSEDLELIGQRHPNNYTIQRALSDYAKRNDVKYYPKVRKENIEEGLQFIDTQVERALKDNTGYSAILFKQGDIYSNLEEIFNPLEES